MKHTPGPWTVDKYYRHDKEIFILEPSVSVNYDDVDHEEQEANARLIAAAPELLEVLKEAFDMIDGVLLTDVFGGEWFEKADEAIKKATGDQA